MIKVNGQVEGKTDYINGYIYKDDELECVMFGEGRAVKQTDGTFRNEYFLTDHLGNVRVMFSDTDEDGEADIVREHHYYPYGMKMGGCNFISGAENKYLYQGKELQSAHNLLWYDFGARYFDHQLGRWHSIDPALQFASPYVGMGNNPVIFTDPDGKSIDWWPFGKRRRQARKGPPSQWHLRGNRVTDWSDVGSPEFNNASWTVSFWDAFGGGSPGANHNNGGHAGGSAGSSGHVLHSTPGSNQWGETPSGNGSDVSVPTISERIEMVSEQVDGAIKSNVASSSGRDLGLLRGIGNVANYASGAIGLTQIGMLEYRTSLPLSSKIGTFSKFTTAYKGLGVVSRTLGRSATFVGAPLSIGLDYSAYRNGDISLGRFGYRTGSLGASIGTGALIGGPWGAAAGAAVGGISVGFEYMYDNFLVPMGQEIQYQIWNFENAIKNGWYPGR